MMEDVYGRVSPRDIARIACWPLGGCVEMHMGWDSEPAGWMRKDLSRTSGNQNGTTSPSAVWANLDDPPIHIRPVVPASAGAEDKNPVGSGHYGMLSIAPRGLNRNGFLCRKCQELGDKGLTALIHLRRAATLCRQRLNNRCLLAQPAVLGHLRSFCGIFRRNHRVGRWQLPLRPVFLGCQAMVGSDVPFEHFEALAAVQANDVIGKDRLPGGNRRFGLGRFGDRLTDRGERLMDTFDEC
jgi:hypothetical protein